MPISTCSITNEQHVGSLLIGSTQDFKVPVQLKIKSQHLNPKVSCSIYGSSIGCKRQREGLYKHGWSVSQEQTWLSTEQFSPLEMKKTTTI